MRPRGRHALLLWPLLCSGLAAALEPLTAGAAALAAAGAGALAPYLFCRFRECCRPPWVSFTASALRADLENKVFGQHIASPIILKAVDGFMTTNAPKKPLVLSLHGWTGTGKNLVSQLIAESLYREGVNSKFVHLFSATLHFPDPKNHLQRYKSELNQWIKEGVSKCERSMFIFDEVDKMHPSLIDSIKPYLDYYDKLDGVSYQKAIFIFLSNAGATSIAEAVLDFWRGGINREEIKYTDLERTLFESLNHNDQGGAFQSSLIDNSLVDFFIPFLPLEYNHVIQCALAAMEDRGIRPNREVAERLAADLHYFPKNERVFSVKGCKTVDTKLNYYL